MTTANSAIQLPHSVVISIEETLKHLGPVSSERCIYRVPVSIRKVNEEAYTPRIVSVGPLHHGRKGLEAMEQQKLRYLQSFLTRVSLKMEKCVQLLRDEEEQIRKCYAQTVELCQEKFIKMVLLDGCFILELLLRTYDDKYIEGEDLLHGKPHMFTEVSLDVLLLENQLPLFVLLGIYDLISFSRRRRLPSIHELVYKFISSVMHMDPPDSNSFPSALHLVDCLRTFYLRKSNNPPDSKGTIPDPGHRDGVMSSFSPSATCLHEAGVKFKKVQSKFLLDLHFDKKSGVLEIPILEIHDSTETILRNQIAFEQCHHQVRPIVQYTTLIDSIIDTPADVNLLMEKGIIKSIVGSSESICQLFNNLGKQAVLGEEDFFIFKLCKDLHGHCGTRRNRWKAILKSQYFHTPWSVISVIAGIILLILTVLQAVCAIIAL